MKLSRVLNIQILLLVALTCLSSVHAESNDHDCSEIRLDAPGGAMENVAVRNQQAIGDCYAQVGAQIFDAKRFREGSRHIDHASSGFEINQRFKIYRGDDSIDGGNLEEVMGPLYRQGSCSEKEITDRIFLPPTKLNRFTTTSTDLYASKVMEIYNDAHRAYNERYLGPSNPDRLDFSQLKQFERFKMDDHFVPVLGPKPQLDPFLPNAMIEEKKWKRRPTRDDFVGEKEWYLDQAIEKLRAYQSTALKVAFDYSKLEQLRPNSDTVTVFEVLDVISCRKRLRIKTPVRFKHHHESGLVIPWLEYSIGFQSYLRRPESALESIHRELNLGIKTAMPIGIGYCAKVLKVGKTFEAKNFDSDSTCGRHASLIIGRRRHPESKQCQLLIRNSWGKNCSYSKDWTCDKNAGSVWVDESALSRAIYETQRVESY
jgi:hypothetical protein